MHTLCDLGGQQVKHCGFVHLFTHSSGFRLSDAPQVTNISVCFIPTSWISLESLHHPDMALSSMILHLVLCMPWCKLKPRLTNRLET